MYCMKIMYVFLLLLPMNLWSLKNKCTKQSRSLPELLLWWKRSLDCPLRSLLDLIPVLAGLVLGRRASTLLMVLLRLPSKWKVPMYWRWWRGKNKWWWYHYRGWWSVNKKKMFCFLDNVFLPISILNQSAAAPSTGPGSITIGGFGLTNDKTTPAPMLGIFFLFNMFVFLVR